MECAPAYGDARWTVGAVLRPDLQGARKIEEVARAAADVVGKGHWLAGATRSSHLTLRRHLEHRRRQVSPADPLMTRYAAALRSVAQVSGPVRLTVNGLILTPGSVMAVAVPVCESGVLHWPGS
jgi:hypothetical protein